tara:strand:+ start:27168 stop:27404 length:237 start_codon:yes stop_codon:yes gene_type:complete
MESKSKEEAGRIVEMFYPLTYTGAIKPYSNKDSLRCAIIHVEGIIDALSEIKDLHVVGNSLINEIERWQEVLTILKEK